MSESKTVFSSSEKNLTNLSSNFVHRGFLFFLVVALLPFFPSEAPEFLNQSIFSTSWELLRLLFVGILISYGLFCRRSNAETSAHIDTPAKPETPQSYVSEILDVSSVFNDYDEVECPRVDDDRKFQSWSSQYQRNEPVVIVSDEIEERDLNKPLLLPVRSLKSSAQDDESEPYGANRSMNSGDHPEDSVVFQSPVPWRLRTERSETKGDSEFSKGMFPQPSVSNEDNEMMRNPSLRPRAMQDLLTNGSQSSPSSTLEMRAKFSEDMVKKKNLKSFSLPIPPPPPPPPHPIHGNNIVFDRKVTMKSFKEELKELSNDHVPNVPVNKPRNSFSGPLSIGKSVRTTRSKDSQNSSTDDSENQNEKVNDRADAETSYKEDALKRELKAETDENEVDKKAEEFIAKFREQIRLQRIDSIKRSANQRTAKKPL